MRPSGLAAELVVPEAEIKRGRIAEGELQKQFVRGIAEWLADWAKRTEDYNQNLICLGDFNIDRKDDPNYEALTSTGLEPPPELEEGLSRTVSDEPGKEHYYDQIAWFTKGGKARHYPLWVEFGM